MKIRTCVLIQVMDTQVRNLLPKEGQAAGGQGWGWGWVPSLRTGHRRQVRRDEALPDRCVGGSGSDCEDRGGKSWGTQGMSTQGVWKRQWP